MLLGSAIAHGQLVPSCMSDDRGVFDVRPMY